MLTQLGQFATQAGIAGGVASLVAFLLTLRPRRRKISASASVEEATAASTLSSASLAMIDDARDDARKARAEADAARQEARDRELQLRLEADEREARHREAIDELDVQVTTCERRLASAEARNRDLEDALRRQGVELPPRRRAYDTDPSGIRTVDDKLPPPTGGTRP